MLRVSVQVKVVNFALELPAHPPIYAIWKWHFGKKHGTADVSKLSPPELAGHGA